MEKWNPMLKYELPKGRYECKLSNGEEGGLRITLFNSEHEIIIDFGAAEAVRMFDESVLLGEQPPKRIDNETNYYEDIIYQIYDGDFLKIINKFTVNIFEEQLFNFAIVSMNYIIDIVARGEPEVSVRRLP